MESRSLLSYLTTRAFLVILLICLTWQTAMISELYFGYKVVSGMKKRIPETVSTECINFCTRYTDLLDFERLNRETGRDWKYSIDFDDIIKYHHELKISEILNYTPSVDEILVADTEGTTRTKTSG